MKTKYFILISLAILFSCENEKQMRFSEFVEIGNVEKVKFIKDSVSFTLSQEQIETFKKEFTTLELAPDATFDSSSTQLEIKLNGTNYEIIKSKDGRYYQINRELVTKNKTDLVTTIFKRGDFDLDNYEPKNKTKIYAISGLGVDSRVFDELELESELVPLEWIEPYENESIESYSLRLAKLIDQSEPFGIMGVSFGGVVATEISQKLNPEFTVLISTAETKDGLTSIFKLIGKYDLNDYLKTNMYDPPRRLSYFMFGTDSKEELDAILEDTDLSFTEWAVDELVNWDNETKLKNVIHICGTEDRIFPPTESRNLHLVEGGGHFMIVDKAKEVSRIINNFVVKKSQ